ncbi:hypothetical protein [Streptomyces xinghaiensis]|uniref:hypothetical protein n=1 Tax=Streptomyces xinghaiensis TaxID=1038928 RepID=UPI0034326FBF
MPKSIGVKCAVLAVSVLAAVGVTAPQAVAVEEPAVRIAANADATTRTLAQADPESVAAAANVCGSGYELQRGIPLPKGTDPSERLATLFSYGNGGKGCLIMDNNVGNTEYMYLKVCKMGGGSCDTDAGNFSQYAGPVRVSNFVCAPVTAKMARTSSSTFYINYKSDYVFPCN